MQEVSHKIYECHFLAIPWNMNYYNVTRSRTQKDGDLDQTLMIAFGKERTVPVSKISRK